MADRHGSFELEAVIIDMSTVVDEAREER